MLGRGCLGSQKALESMSYKEQLETSLVAQWLRFCAGGMGSIPGQQTKIPHTLWCSQKKKKTVKEAKCVWTGLGKRRPKVDMLATPNTLRAVTYGEGGKPTVDSIFSSESAFILTDGPKLWEGRFLAQQKYNGDFSILFPNMLPSFVWI